jgi:hypothetical protein
VAKFKKFRVQPLGCSFVVHEAVWLSSRNSEFNL